MALETRRLVLASASPQRARLLEQLGLDFSVRPADIDETPLADEDPTALAVRLARIKTETIAEALAGEGDPALVIGSDTVVAHGDQAFGKPRDLADARRMLGVLANTTHRVITGVALKAPGVPIDVRHVISEVTLAPLDAATITAYWATGEPQGAAGAYAVQGMGGQFVVHLAGSFSAVMGLPVYETAAMLRAVGIDSLARQGVDHIL